MTPTTSCVNVRLCAMRRQPERSSVVGAQNPGALMQAAAASMTACSCFRTLQQYLHTAKLGSGVVDRRAVGERTQRLPGTGFALQIISKMASSVLDCTQWVCWLLRRQAPKLHGAWATLQRRLQLVSWPLVRTFNGSCVRYVCVCCRASVLTSPVRPSAVPGQRRTDPRMATPVRLLVVSSADSPELSVLKQLPQDVSVVGIGRRPQVIGHAAGCPCGCPTAGLLLNDIAAIVMSVRSWRGCQMMRGPA
jgi:hypothetical protein